MKKRMGIVLLTVGLLLNGLFGVGCALAESDGPLHLYREIPFETPTQEAVLEVLLKSILSIPFFPRKSVCSVHG